MWKNGQCVTVKGKKYRVKPSWQRFPCPLCALFYELGKSAICDKLCLTEHPKLNDDSHLEELPAKGKVLAK